MKKIISILAVVLLLTGCANKEPDVTPSTNAVPSPIRVSYMTNSNVEQETKGAIRFYSVSEGVERLDLLESGLAVSDSAGQIVVISEDNAAVLSSDSTEQIILSVHNKSVITYIPKDRTLRILDDKLAKTIEYTLEDGVIDIPVAGNEEVFYCVDDHIRALSLQSGLVRNVMQYVSANQYLTGSYFGGEVLGWNDGGQVTYLSSKDGQSVFADPQLLELYTDIDHYYGVYMDGMVKQRICGSVDGQPMQIVLDHDTDVYPQLNNNCITSVKSTENGLDLGRYDINNGTCNGQLSAKISGTILDFAASDTFTWILTTEGLYRWEHTAVDTQEVSCLAPLVNQENPDIEALAICTDRANAIGEKYGVEIHIWKDALLNDETYVVTAEYQVQTINKMLDEVEAELGQIPEQLLKSTDEYCGFQICLVRSISGYDFVQYRAENGLCIAITPGANMKEALLTGLGWGVDSCIIGNSRDLDNWDELNPAGFDYDYSYFVNDHRTDLEYLEGEYRAFVDKRSMSFPSEDRARIFYYAISEGNQDLFKSPTLQAKLKTLCEGIREAYKWQKETQSFPWEQYLDHSLAYN